MVAPQFFNEQKEGPTLTVDPFYDSDNNFPSIAIGVVLLVHCITIKLLCCTSSVLFILLLFLLLFLYRFKAKANKLHRCF